MAIISFSYLGNYEYYSFSLNPLQVLSSLTSCLLSKLIVEIASFLCFHYRSLLSRLSSLYTEIPSVHLSWHVFKIYYGELLYVLSHMTTNFFFFKDLFIVFLHMHVCVSYAFLVHVEIRRRTLDPLEWK